MELFQGCTFTNFSMPFYSFFTPH